MANGNSRTHILKGFALSALMIGAISSGVANAAPRDPAGGSAKIVNKLQAMVNEITTQRDLLKTDNDKLKAEFDALKKELEKSKTEKTLATAAEDKLTGELSTQKSSNEEIHSRLDSTTAKLHEVIEKYNVLNKSKNQLSAEQVDLQNIQKTTIADLTACESKNLKMYQVTQEIMDNYQRSQNRGVMDALLESEPIFQIKDVEFKTIIQEYQDKLNKQKYQKPTATK
jgi:chromosome segregation ATPase